MSKGVGPKTKSGKSYSEISKENYEKRIAELNEKYADFIKSCPKEITGVESFVILSRTEQGLTAGFNHEDFLTEDLRSELSSLFISSGL